MDLKRVNIHSSISIDNTKNYKEFCERCLAIIMENYSLFTSKQFINSKKKGMKRPFFNYKYLICNNSIFRLWESSMLLEEEELWLNNFDHQSYWLTFYQMTVHLFWYLHICQWRYWKVLMRLNVHIGINIFRFVRILHHSRIP